MRITRLALGVFQSNCYVVSSDDGGAAVVIDPGSEPERIEEAVERAGGELKAILLTHAHLDHIGAVGPLRRLFEVPVYLHPEDRPLYDAAPDQAAAFGLATPSTPAPDRALSHGDRLRFGDLAFTVRHAPGHSPGHVVFVSDDAAFVGDCVFAGSIGRTDLPGGDTRTLLESIRDQILALPPRTVLYPGHGPETTVEREAGSNPFLTGSLGWSG